MDDGGAPTHASEQPRSRRRRAPGVTRRLRRLRTRRAVAPGAPGHRAHARSPRRGRDSPRPVGEARRRVPDSCRRAARPVPAWATLYDFRRLEAEGLTMFGQMTAGSWIYIGTQGILQGTYQTFCAAAEKHFGTPDLAGRTVLTAGLGGMGGAQPLAATMAGAAILCVEVDQRSIDRRLTTRYLDEQASSLDDALARVRAAAAVA